MRRAAHLVFEGAQGLLLDQDLGRGLGFFPHVTRSHTGLRNVAALARSAGVDRLRVHYVLRPYLTRHGAGPLPGATGAAPPYPGIEDRTNLPNAWQGSLRFGFANLDLLRCALARDAAHAALGPGLRLERRLALTCLDQVGGAVEYVEHGRKLLAAPDEFLLRCMAAAGTATALVGHGPTRATCRDFSRLRAPAAAAA
jgi:adenylosuccinate synthase